MAGTNLEQRHQGVVARLQAMRQEYEALLSGVKPEVAQRGSEWSVVDLLNHVAQSGMYRNMVERLANPIGEERPSFSGFGAGPFDPAAWWRRQAERTLASFDEAIALATSLTPEQLRRTGQRGGATITAVDALEEWANHYEDHLKQLRDEILPREAARDAGTS